MNDEKYIGLDVHQATIVVAVMDSTGKLVMESILETEAATILQFGAVSVKTLKASLLASAIGTGAWMLGLTRAMWPAHPQLAVFILTVGATAVLMYVLPEPQK